MPALLWQDFTRILRFGAGAPRYAERIWVNPSDVWALPLAKKKEVGWDRFASARVVSQWPAEHIVTLDRHEKIAFCIEHWKHGLEWNRTSAIGFYSSKSKSPGDWVTERHRPLDDIFETVRREQRLRSMRELRPFGFREDGGVRINVGPSGQLVFCDGGTHRLAMAWILGISCIPAQIGVVHINALDHLPALRRKC